MSNINKKYTKNMSESRRRSEDQSEFVYIGSLIKAMCTNLEDRYPVDTDGRVLFDAIRNGKQHLVRFILEAAPGNVVNARDFNGKTALIVVSSIKEEFRRSSVTRLLLYHGANINLCDDHGRTPLSHACEKRCNDLVEIFVKQSHVDPELVDDKGNSALMYCAMVGNDTGINTLMRHFRRLGLKVDVVNKDGFTPMLIAAKNGNISCARILFQQGKASLLSRDPISNKTVEELLEKNGFTLEDLLPFEKQLEAKKRFNKIIHFARLTKSFKASMKTDSRKSGNRNRSVESSKELHDKEMLPRGNQQSYLRHTVLPPIQSNLQGKSRKRETKNSLPLHIANDSAGARYSRRRRRMDCVNRYEDDSSLSSGDTFEEDIPEEDFNGLYSDVCSSYTDEECL